MRKQYIKAKFPLFESEISLKFQMCAFFSTLKQQQKCLSREKGNLIFNHRCQANHNLIFILTHCLFAPPVIALSKKKNSQCHQISTTFYI